MNKPTTTCESVYNNQPNSVDRQIDPQSFSNEKPVFNRVLPPMNGRDYTMSGGYPQRPTAYINNISLFI
jgi:hypothetical protein